MNKEEIKKKERFDDLRRRFRITKTGIKELLIKVEIAEDALIDGADLKEVIEKLEWAFHKAQIRVKPDIRCLQNAVSWGIDDSQDN